MRTSVNEMLEEFEARGWKVIQDEDKIILLRPEEVKKQKESDAS